MASKFIWDQYESAEDFSRETEPESEKETSASVEASFTPIEKKSDSPQEAASIWDQYDSVAPPGVGERIASTALETGKGVGRVAGRTGTSLIAAPSKSLGGALEILGNLLPQGAEGGLQNPLPLLLQNVGKFLQKTGKEGQAFLNSELEKALGTPSSSLEESITRLGERGADIYGRGPFKGLGVPAALGAAGGQITEELGGGEVAQTVAEIVSSGGREIGKGLQHLKSVVSKSESGLILPRIVEKTKEGFRFLKPKVFEKSKEKAYKKVSDQATQLINEIKSESLPIAKQIEKGIDVEANLNKDFEKVKQLASKFDNKIESNLISDYLQNIEEQIKAVPVPTEEQEKVLKLVDKYKAQYGPHVGGTRFFSPKQYVDQFRGLNKDAKRLYETALLEGKQQETISFYEGLKGEIDKTLEAGTTKEFSELFKETNKRKTELSRLESFETVMENATKDGVLDPVKLRNIFRSPRKTKAFRRQLGDKGFDRFKMLSDDLHKVKDKLKLVGEFGLTDLVKSGTASKVLSMIGLKMAMPAVVAKKVGEGAFGYFLLNSQGGRDVTNFLKAVQSGSKKAMATYLKRLDKHALEFEESVAPDVDRANKSN